ncbi:hypothetical protein M758_UG315900 [Ceratodon purpureus]|nr:hypothetical protein M758_UG315900 [Ceratodon purpureus]
MGRRVAGQRRSWWLQSVAMRLLLLDSSFLLPIRYPSFLSSPTDVGEKKGFFFRCLFFLCV